MTRNLANLRNEPLAQSRLGKAWVWSIVAGAIVALAVKLWLASATFGTYDMASWQIYQQLASRVGTVELYRRLTVFNHPPFMAGVLKVMGRLTDASGIPFFFWMRLPAILADVGSLVLVYRMVWHKSHGRFSPGALLLLALCPISIMISGFHGNTDPIMIFFLLLSVYFLDVHGLWWAAGVALGMSLNIKVVPIALTPIFFYLPTWKRRIGFFALAGAVFLLASLPYIVQEPRLIIGRVFGYGSTPGIWGVGRLLRITVGLSSAPGKAFEACGRYVVLATMTAAAYAMNRGPHRPTLFRQCGVGFFLFMAISPGFGVQYLAWRVPWAVELGFVGCLVFYATAGAFLFMVYRSWAAETSWLFAHASDSDAPWQGTTVVLELICWATVVACLVMLARRPRPHETEPLDAAGRDASPRTERADPPNLSRRRPAARRRPKSTAPGR